MVWRIYSIVYSISPTILSPRNNPVNMCYGLNVPPTVPRNSQVENFLNAHRDRIRRWGL